MFETANLIAVLIAAIVSMAIGAGWYSTFGTQWMEAVGFSQDEKRKIDQGGSAVIYVIAFASLLVIAFALSCVMRVANVDGIVWGLIYGAVMWAGFIAPPIIINHRFQMKSWTLTVIDTGHYLLVLVVQGIIIGWGTNWV